MASQKDNNYFQFFDVIEKYGVKFASEEKARIIRKMDNFVSYEPCIGILGMTGAGKSSLCNALFGQNIAKTSDIEMCTRNTQEIFIGFGTKRIKLIDTPSVGESDDIDKKCVKLYSKLLPELDMVLWISTASGKTLSDASYYNKIVKPYVEMGKQIFVVINQVDKIDPFKEWNVKNNCPGTRQLKKIGEKIQEISDVFDLPKTRIIAISSEEKFNLVDLVDSIIHELPNEKKIIYLNFRRRILASTP